MTNVHISDCALTNAQIGDYNSMTISDIISASEWKNLESFFGDKLKTVEKEYYFLVKEAEDYAKKRNKNGLKDFINKYAVEFAAGIFCNTMSAGIKNLLQKLGIWI